MISDYYQYFPLVLGLLGILLSYALNPNPGHNLNYSTEDILASSAFRAVTSKSYQATILISIGILIPFINNLLFSLFFSSNSRRMELYLLLILVFIIEALNILIITQSYAEDPQYMWLIYFGSYIQRIAISSVVYSLQLSVAKHSKYITTCLSVSAILYNACMVTNNARMEMDTCELSIAYCILLVGTILCNIGVAWLWFRKFLHSYHLGLHSYQQEFFSVCEICTLIAYMFVQLFLFEETGDEIDNMSNTYCISLAVFLIVLFYGVVEIYFMRVKLMADSSVVSIISLLFHSIPVFLTMFCFSSSSSFLIGCVRDKTSLCAVCFP